MINGATNIKLEHNVSVETLNNYFNNDRLKKAKQIFDNFFIKEKELIVKDKHEQDYKLIIVSNSDISIGAHLYIDEVMLFKNDQKIGFLKAKYTTKELVSLYPEYESDNFFVNKATIDYSLLEDEYKNKGLGYIMYFHMAQHLTKKNIEFRQSTLCSEEAQLLWKGFAKHFPEFITTKKIEKTFVNFLKIGEDVQPVFNNGTISAIKIKP